MLWQQSKIESGVLVENDAVTAATKLDAYLTRIKVYFTLVSIAIIIMLLFSAVAVKKSVNITNRSIFQTISFLRYRTQFILADTARDGLLAGLTSVTASPVRYTGEYRNTGSVPILVYHGVLSESDGTTVNITEKNFKDHLFALAHAGYRSISLKELQAFLEGRGEIPQKAVLISFDDGRTDSFDRGDPILHAAGFSAVMFGISKYSIDQDSSYYMNIPLMKHMEKTGRWDIQAHTDAGHDVYSIDSEGTRGNFYSNLLWLPSERLETPSEYDARIAADLAIAKEKFETTLEKPIFGFAFPFGDFGQLDSNLPEKPEQKILQHAYEHYPLLFYQYAPGHRFLQNYQKDDGETHFLIKRINVDGTWSGSELLSIIENSSAKSPEYHDIFENDAGWINAWGEVYVNGARLGSSDEPDLDTPIRGLYLSANKGSHGAAAILDGTRAWQNYTIEASVRSPLQNGVFLWVRFQNDTNNAACNIGNGFAHVEQTINGKKRVIQGTRASDIVVPDGAFTVSARVFDRTIQCLVNGKVLVESRFVDPVLDKGGIGFKTWDPELRASAFIVEEVRVTSL